MSNSKKSKFSSNQWFCIGTSGHTADGREIKPEWLTQAAEDYSPETYGARINVEHYRSIWPNSDMAGYGDVTALKTETDGNTVKLYAQISPTEKLIALNQASEKIYTSMELHTNFANSQRAYLIGLAITDSPASLGTSALKFNTNANSPFSLKPEFFISEPIAMTQKTEPAQNVVVAESESPPSWFANLFKVKAEPTKESTELVELREQTQQGFEAASEAVKNLEKKQEQQFTSLREEIAKLTKQLSEQPQAPASQNLHVGTNANLKHKPADY